MFASLRRRSGVSGHSVTGGAGGASIAPSATKVAALRSVRAEPLMTMLHDNSR